MREGKGWRGGREKEERMREGGRGKERRKKE